MDIWNLMIKFFRRNIISWILRKMTNYDILKL